MRSPRYDASMVEQATAWTVRRLLEWTPGFFQKKEVDQPRLAAELLLSHVLGVPRIRLYTNYNDVVGDAKLAKFRDLVRRAAEQEPIAYLTGRAHFFSLEFEVTPDVLIPRPDTETLVENVLQTIRHTAGLEAPRVLDLCTGSGCIAISIAKNCKPATVTAIDISPAAIEVARRNAQANGVADRITFLTGDLFAPLAETTDAGPFDILTANPPYIASGQVPRLDKSVQGFEPRLALDGGPDGLDFHRRILEQATARLKHAGQLFLEIAFDQGQAAESLAARHPGLEKVRLLKDYGGNPRVLTAIVG
jgi:release factor glutamine methyltransferase